MLGNAKDQNAYRLLELNAGNVFNTKSAIFKEECDTSVGKIHFDYTDVQKR